MQIIRKYKKNDWWDFLTVIEQELERSDSKDTYLDIFDELQWRLTESISEGSTFKIKKKMSELFDRFLEKSEKDPDFASTQEIKDLKEMIG